MGFWGSSVGKESACSAGDLGSIPGLRWSPGEGKGYPLQYSGLENSMDYTVHGVHKSWTRLSFFHLADNHSAGVLARSAMEREAPKTSAWSEVITGFSSRGRLVSSKQEGKLLPLLRKTRDDLGRSRLSASSGSNQLPSFHVSGFLSFLISALTFTWEMVCWGI